MSTPSPISILRLKKAGRYVVVTKGSDGHVSAPFWTEAQALMSWSIPAREWSSVPTEVYAEIHAADMPADVTMFARSTRRGLIHGVVLWTEQGVFPRVLDTVDEALSMAARINRLVSRDAAAPECQAS
ncbi:hypothetical protein [Neorhizobium sp. NCHU2750]|uniref:hypothetical protein n=1 Tax=Neorhizobium sp. NCHU2750 TaxID=1825976 RepID=UPI000E73424D|nr:hypothetical protein NCHU2750_20770 [Neorhizobium sp. NCHU2750]